MQWTVYKWTSSTEMVSFNQTSARCLKKTIYVWLRTSQWARVGDLHLPHSFRWCSNFNLHPLRGLQCQLWNQGLSTVRSLPERWQTEWFQCKLRVFIKMVAGRWPVIEQVEDPPTPVLITQSRNKLGTGARTSEKLVWFVGFTGTSGQQIYEGTD